MGKRERRAADKRSWDTLKGMPRLLDLLSSTLILAVASGVIVLIESLIPAVRLLEGSREHLIALEYVAVGFVFSAFLLEEVLAIYGLLMRQGSGGHIRDSLGRKALVLLVTLGGSLGVVVAAETLPGSRSVFYGELAAEQDLQVKTLRSEVATLQAALQNESDRAENMRQAHGDTAPANILEELERLKREMLNMEWVLAKKKLRLLSLESARPDPGGE